MNGLYRSSAAAGAGTLGIVLALVALVLAFFPAGAGHGWGAPLFFSIPLFIIYPVALIRSRVGRGKGIAPDIALVSLGIVADIALVWSAVDYRAEWMKTPRESLVPGVDRSVFPIFLLWLALWLYWQFVAIRSLLRHVRREPGEGSLGSRS